MTKSQAIRANRERTALRYTSPPKYAMIGLRNKDGPEVIGDFNTYPRPNRNNH